jgi:hypothetical protein
MTNAKTHADWPPGWTLGYRDVAFQLSKSFKPPIAFTTLKMGRKHVSSLAFILPILASTVDAASDPARPRGVGPECMFTH